MYVMFIKTYGRQKCATLPLKSDKGEHWQLLQCFSICVRGKRKSQGLQPLACAPHIDGAQSGFLQHSHHRHLQIRSKDSSKQLKGHTAPHVATRGFGLSRMTFFGPVKKFLNEVKLQAELWTNFTLFPFPFDRILPNH